MILEVNVLRNFCMEPVCRQRMKEFGWYMVRLLFANFRRKVVVMVLVKVSGKRGYGLGGKRIEEIFVEKCRFL